MWESAMNILHIILLSLSVCAVNACKYSYSKNEDLDWWKTSIVYQIYPRSFMDSDGDGIGDLNGITQKLSHISDIGADAIWLSPIFTSPQVDFGYDISNFTDIDPQFGILEDFERLTATAKSLGIKVMLDFVPNHTSSKHEWFVKSEQGIEPYTDYFIWQDGQLNNGQILPPNNWVSVFGGSAWEWSDQRRQYYLHQFAVMQPDLNYRNPKVQKAMKDALTFWMLRGVDGFRVDSVNFIFENPDYPDEPLSGMEVSNDDYNYVIHNYTRDQDENYDLVESWAELLENHAKRYKTDAKFMLLEAYTTTDLSMKYYSVGANPFNFMFIDSLNRESTASDFKFAIDNWMNNMPQGSYANWVTGNHDNHRVATRYGTKRADQLSMLAIMLPGISVVYNGDEIGMVDRPMTYQETVDPAGCILGPDRYWQTSRDPERTPFQWNDDTSAGFSTNETTWLPVNENYETLNLEAQKAMSQSHYKVFKELTRLKKKPIVQKGTFEVTLPADNVLAVIRRLPMETAVVLLINFSEIEVTVDWRTCLNIPEQMTIYVASVASELQSGSDVNTKTLKLPGAASIILSNKSLVT